MNRRLISFRRRQANRSRALKFGAVALIALFAAMFGTVALSAVRSHDAPSAAMSSLPVLGLGCLMFRSPEAAGGGGSSNQDKGPFDAENAPALEGETLEAKNASAAGIISRLFSAGKDLVSRLSTANNERTRLEEQFNAATSDLTKERTDHAATKGELASAKTTITGLTSERDTANKNVERLEKLCSLRGIDHTAAVPPVQAPESNDSTPAGKWEKYQSLRKDENDGKVDPGTAQAYWKANRADLQKHANSQRGK